MIRLTPVGRGPVQVAVTADHRVIVANQGSAKQPDNRVSIFDGASGAALATVEVGQGAHGVALDRDGASAYVTNTYSNTLSVIDLGTLKEVSRVPTGERPNGVVSQ